MYAPAFAARASATDRAASVWHTPHPVYLGQARTPSGMLVPRTRDEELNKDKPQEEEGSNTVLYVGIGLGVLCVGGLVVYLATRKKGRRR